MSAGIAEALIREFTRSWRMLRRAITAFPAAEWRRADTDYLMPARHALHIIGAVDLYLRPEYVPGIAGGAGRFGHGLDWEGSCPKDLPAQEEQLQYLDQIESKLRTWLDSKGDGQFLAPAKGFEWGGPTLLSRMLYLLGHNQHHQGILQNELRRRGLRRPSWD